MPTHETLERFIAKVEWDRHDEAIAEFYTPDSTMRENQEEPRRGRENNVAREKTFLARVNSLRSKCVRPVFQSGDFVVIRWHFRFVFSDGKVMEMEEIAYQRWDGERIAEEQFFYDPAQRQLK
jgi:ketosteroid isomerase-like protein